MPLPSPSSINTYGGVFVDYINGAVDPTTDLGAAPHNQAMADLAGLTRTGIKAWCTFTSNPAGAVTASDAVWGNGTPPTFAAAATGKYNITFPSSITDALGASQAVNFTVAVAHFQSQGPTLGRISSCTKTSANVVQVQVVNDSGTLADTNGTIFLFLI